MLLHYYCYFSLLLLLFTFIVKSLIGDVNDLNHKSGPRLLLPRPVLKSEIYGAISQPASHEEPGDVNVSLVLLYTQ